jgi:adenylate kinase
MSRGELVPDEVTIGMLRNKMSAHEDANGFIFDGFPRTTPQAEALDALLEDMGPTYRCIDHVGCAGR